MTKDINHPEFEHVGWNNNTLELFHQLIAKIPGPMQSFAQDKVLKKAVRILKDQNKNTMEEKDLVDAFFEATPFGFHGPLKNDMQELGIDYVQYGHPE